jgi:hypothetical protein
MGERRMVLVALANVGFRRLNPTYGSKSVCGAMKETRVVLGALANVGFRRLDPTYGIKIGLP